MRPFLTMTVAASICVAPAAQEPLTDTEIRDVVALGTSCGEVPLVKVTDPRGDFDVFIEGPVARVAIQAAAAAQMRRPFDASMVTPEMTEPTFRVWLQYTLYGRRTISVDDVVLQPAGRNGARDAMRPFRQQPFELTIGHLPAHGIVDAVRFRWTQWTFDRLPAGPFDVILSTTAGVQRYTVTDKDRSASFRVCTG